MSRVLLCTLVAGAAAFQVAPIMSRRAAVSVAMKTPVEEKKGFSLFGFGKTDSEMEGKVVSTGKGGEEELSESKQLMQKVKDAGVAGIISYIFWEWAFWGVSVPVALFGFQAAVGYWPDFSNPDDMAKLGAEAFAFVNVARFAVPLRIGLALGTTPWVQANLVDKFKKNDDSA